jgi:hypothetical protein
MMMKRIAAATILAFATMIMPLTSTAAAAPASPTQLPVVGSVVGGGTFAGTLNLTKFANVNGTVNAIGTLTGVLTNAAGQTTTVMQNISAPLAAVTGTCNILHLDLGPLHLDILGLQVDLSRVILDITAQSGAGNLLGNLLCGVANLLNNPGGLATLLNQILAAL